MAFQRVRGFWECWGKSTGKFCSYPHHFVDGGDNLEHLLPGDVAVAVEVELGMDFTSDNNEIQ